ncbi:OmpA family protein [Sphingomonas sp. R647]|uniref:OmpA family protein n=1 Tax=Sphingomonas sp. R647 TaxID=2875233 RepID=UPI001CD39E8A|nr:OmpA family protein [Sphingomonas sp. R647]MCA1199306.1 OmpA family protein [Sphingomonas sp. R647]
MFMRSITPKILVLTALFASAAPASLAAQEAAMQPESDVTIQSTALPPLEQLAAGPEVSGMISARKGDQIQVTTADGTPTLIAVTGATDIRASGGFLGLSREKLGADALLNGLPVTIRTRDWNGTLVASQIKLQNKDLKTASMIRNGTDQRFGEQAAATEALKGRVGDIDQYNVKGTTNVNFDTGKAVLSAQAKAELCNAASQAGSMENALLLVVGYTDATGSEELNQELSEKRASRVVNHLQQACGWKPYRMLTPTGMAEADPLADNMTEEGKAQNRRVAVNILVSKAVDGL